MRKKICKIVLFFENLGRFMHINWFYYEIRSYVKYFFFFWPVRMNIHWSSLSFLSWKKRVGGILGSGLQLST